MNKSKTLLRIENLEIRYSGFNETYELVCYDKLDVCYVLAFLRQNFKEPDVKIELISNRIFEIENPDLGFDMLKTGYDIVNSITQIQLKYER